MLYDCDFEYSIREGGSVTLEARDINDAEERALEYVNEVYDDVFDVTIIGVRENKDEI